MKYAKMLGLLAIAAAALMAFAGTASATLTEAAGDPVDVGDTIKAESAGATTLDGTINISCQNSTVEGEVTSNGATTASGTINVLTFTNCGNHTVSVQNEGTLSVETTGANKGTARSTGAEVTVLTHSLFLGTRHCIYTTNNTDVGTVTGGTTASMSIDSLPIPQTATDSLCGNDAEWTGKYTVTQPDTLIID